MNTKKITATVSETNGNKNKVLCQITKELHTE